MTLISKPLVGILFGGPAVTLASAAWKGNLRAIYGFNAAGNGYTVFKPANAFNSLTQLVPDGSHILDVATPGFELPGAVLTTSGVDGPTLAIAELSSGYDPDINNVYVRCQLAASQTSDTTANVLLAFPDRNDPTACQAAVWTRDVALGQSVSLPIAALANTQYGLNQDDVLELFAVAPSGAVVYQQFAFGG